MKLLFCANCGGAVGLRMERWLRCPCKKSGGQYNVDSVTATVGGMAEVFGVPNTFFWKDDGTNSGGYPRFGSHEQRDAFNVAAFGHKRDAWWGEYPGDQQIFRIKSPRGPRIRLDYTVSEDNMWLHVSIRPTWRYFNVGGKVRPRELTIQINSMPVFKDYDGESLVEDVTQETTGVEKTVAGSHSAERVQK